MNRINVKQSGNWSDLNTWPCGTLPTSGDIVYTNGHEVIIDTDIHVNRLTNEFTYLDIYGGSFIALDGVTIKANISNMDECIVLYTGTSAINIIGNIEGGRSKSSCIENRSTGTINITGNVKGGGSADSYGILNFSTGTINLTGIASVGEGQGAHAIINNSGTIIINGIEYTEPLTSYGKEVYYWEITPPYESL